MNYFDIIRELTKAVPKTLVDFSISRKSSRTPTQASSYFITNKEQGDWAESLIIRAINETSKNCIAVKYGKSDDLIAGEDGFDTFYQEFQNELDTIGKRPDLLIFKKTDFDADLGLDISHEPHEKMFDYVRKAIAGIEVRSSAFLIDRYEAAMHERTTKNTEIALQIRNKILSEYSDLINHPTRRKYIPLLEAMTAESLGITNFKVPGWSSSERLIELKELFKKLKNSLKILQKRDFLSITPKVEDLKVVYKWIETYNVPHFYFQVFFDKVYGIAFPEILTIISDSENEDLIFSVETDTKNQNKTTIKINSKNGTPIAYKINEPNHRSVRKEMGRGRLLFYVTFDGGTAYLDIDNLKKLLGLNEQEF
jgi:type II restriction enzyme